SRRVGPAAAEPGPRRCTSGRADGERIAEQPVGQPAQITELAQLTQELAAAFAVTERPSQEEEAKALTYGLDRGHRSHGRGREGARARSAGSCGGRARVRGRRRGPEGPVRHRPGRRPHPGPGEADLAGEAVRPQAAPPTGRALTTLRTGRWCAGRRR